MVRYTATGLDIATRRHARHFSVYSPKAEEHRLQWFSDEAEKVLDDLWTKNCILDHQVDEVNVFDTDYLDIEQEDSSVLSSVSYCSPLLAPIQMLPPEILGKIFCFALPANQYVCMDKDSLPLLLARVCSLWREVALSTPYLWASIMLGDVTSKGPGKHWPHPEGVQVWLRRSGNCALSIKICSGKGRATAYIPILMSFSARFEELSFHNFSARTLCTLFSGGHHYPRLKRLAFQTPYSREFDRNLDVKACAPLLEFFAVHIVVAPKSVPITMAWTQLTDLRLGAVVTANAMFRLLRQCSQLTCLHLVVSPMRYPCLGPEVTHTNLRAFNIWGDSSCDLPLELLTLPALRWAQVNFKANASRDPRIATEDTFQITKLTDLVVRSKCPLRGLFIAGLCVTADEWQRCFQVTRLIRELTVVEHKDLDGFTTDGILQVLTCPEGGYTLLPQLRSLSLIGCSKWARNMASALLQMRSSHTIVKQDPEDPVDVPDLIRPVEMDPLDEGMTYFRLGLGDKDDHEILALRNGSLMETDYHRSTVWD